MKQRLKTFLAYLKITIAFITFTIYRRKFPHHWLDISINTKYRDLKIKELSLFYELGLLVIKLLLTLAFGIFYIYLIIFKNVN